MKRRRCIYSLPDALSSSFAFLLALPAAARFDAGRFSTGACTTLGVSKEGKKEGEKIKRTSSPLSSSDSFLAFFAAGFLPFAAGFLTGVLGFSCSKRIVSGVAEEEGKGK